MFRTLIENVLIARAREDAKDPVDVQMEKCFLGFV